MQLLPGFRDFFPDDCARRQHVLSTWREVARRYGFVEVDGPALEPVELYLKKSGGELVGQLFEFEDKGGRRVAMRPEMTPTLARMVAARERDFRKPLKWFSVAQFFRYEKQQRGRLREFLQLNCDLVGDGTPAADAEILALLIDLHRAFGFTESDFVVRLSDRNAWVEFLRSKGHGPERAAEFLPVIDKLERESPETLARQLADFDCTEAGVRAFIADPAAASPTLRELADNLRGRGLGGFFEIDLTIVRGLAYYTGLVFEVFDRAKKFRALAGGGRYDNLLSLMSDGGTDLPAVGFGMGDVVLGELIRSVPAASALAEDAAQCALALDVFVIVADEARRSEALGLVQRLRESGVRADYPLARTKVGKQFQQAEQSGARTALLVGAEWPQVKIKNLVTREETLVSEQEVAANIVART